jgi:eukaryotic-like serine/threonine-protein kinase
MTANEEQAKSLFLAALECAPERWPALLDDGCRGNAELRARVEQLLYAHQAMGKIGGHDAEDEPEATIVPIHEGPGTLVGPYKLLQLIGEGGFGLVYMAEQEKPVRRTVALKIIKPGMDSAQVVARFESERQALALMDHPNVARVLDAGATQSGHPYFVMELVKGVPITEFCDKNHFPLDQRLKLFLDVCHAIQHAHQKGVIHRDIKPSNVMVTLHDGVPVVKVIDFGIAKATGQKLTERTLFTAYGQMIGTPAYMSPEQAEMSGLDVDTRTDVYSLGVLLYELLTGTTPLEVERLRDVGYAKMQKLIQEEATPRPSLRLSSLGESATLIAGNRGLDVQRLRRLLASDLDWIVMKALEKDRNRRYPTPDAFADDIERYLQLEAIEARPPSTVYRLRKFALRNRVAVLTVSAVAVALLAGITVSLLQTIRAMHAEKAALASAERERNASNAATIAALAEKRAKDAAVAREAETKTVLGFVQDHVFAAARPEKQAGGLGRGVTLEKAIESAVPYVETSFRNEPLVEARLRLTLAWSYHYLGDGKAALQQATAAQALFTRHSGKESADTLASRDGLSAAYSDLDRYQEALSLDQETLAIRNSISGSDPRDIVRTMGSVAFDQIHLGRYPEAQRLCDEALSLAKATIGTNQPETIAIMSRLATIDWRLGRYGDALALDEETVRLSKATLGPDHPETLDRMGQLVDSYCGFGRVADAAKIEEEVLAIRKAKLGPDHPKTINAMAILGLCYSKVGRMQEALNLLEDALAKGKRGPSSAELGHIMVPLGDTYRAVGRYDDAVKLLTDAVNLRKVALGPEHSDTLYARDRLAMCYYLLGRYADALKTYEETLALGKAKLGPDHPETLDRMTQVAKCLAALHRGPEALPIIRQVIASSEKQNRTDALALYNAACSHAVAASALRACNKPGDAAHEAELAMDWLKRAIAAGFHDALLVKGDTDLAALRDRDDFKKTLTDLEASGRTNVNSKP